MEIRIRRAEDTDSRLLAEIPFRKEAVADIIPTLDAWGVVDAGGRMWQSDEITGQFVDDGTKAYFEVILGGG